MFNITFNPGPSQISPETKDDMRRAMDERILEISHRSAQFSDISRNTISQLRKYLGIPKDYKVFYMSSATACWHSILANGVAQKSFHFINGSFSEKFAKASQALGKKFDENRVELGQQNSVKSVAIEGDCELISLCYNETSTGVMIENQDLKYLRETYRKKLLAVDITSCAGAINAPIEKADVWYFSVQKCFGLPPGLGILIISPEAFERSKVLANEGKNMAGIWQWSFLEKTMISKDHQTPQTPNILNIFLLGEQCKRWNAEGGLKAKEKLTQDKAQMIKQWVQSHPQLEFFVSNERYRSTTALTIKSTPEFIEKIHKTCSENKIVMGKGYGDTKSYVFRIANFPSVTKANLETLFDLI